MLKRGDVLPGRYRIKRVLSKGGMGVIYLADDTSLQRQVVVKTVLPKYSHNEYLVERLIYEGQTIASLRHPHILTVHYLGYYQEAEDQARMPFLVMDYTDGGSLTDKIEAGRLKPEECAQILTSVCKALDHAHRCNVVHLDLKPDNILFDQEGNVVVADFGIARLLQTGGTAKARTGLGTPEYMAPEQVAGLDIGPFSDVYSLGVTLHEMLTGVLPQTRNVIKGANILVDPLLAAEFRPIIEKATQTDPRDRYASAGALAQAFSQALEKLAGTAVPPTATQSILTAAPRRISQTTLGQEQADELQWAMRELGQFVAKNGTINGWELLIRTFKPAGLFAVLGYGKPGLDELVECKLADVVLSATGGRVIAVVGFMRPAISLQAGLEQLENKYVPRILPDVGVLCNGHELAIYGRQGKVLRRLPVLWVALKDATESDARTLYAWLGEQRTHFSNAVAFEEALLAAVDDPIPVLGLEHEGGQAFLHRFALAPGTVFGRLVETTDQVLRVVLQDSYFAWNAFNAWQQSCARELRLKDAPKTWRPFLADGWEDLPYQFIFALESAYTILSRLFLAKVAADRYFP
ncbi:MAG: serine/threonine protein kinase, partial [Chloroflexi bacterium]|nr:serine/threonine protein kinase [Chloroflexota bacterium]